MTQKSQAVNPEITEAESRLPEIIALMVEDRLNFRQVATLLELGLTDRQMVDMERRKSFKKALADARRHHFETAGSPTETTKTAMVGAMLDDARHLRERGKHKEAGELTAAAAKIMGYANSETTVNLLGDISPADVARLKEKIAAKRAETIQ